MMAGVFTPTEAAFAAAVYALILGLFVYREIKWRELPKLFLETVETNAVVLMLVMTASLFGWVLARAQVPQMLGAWILGTTQNPLLILLMLNVFLLIVGCFMEALAALIILVPVFMPVIKAVGIDPVHFGVVYTVNSMIGTITPPVGMIMYVVCALGKVGILEFTREVWPFLIALTIALALVTYIPSLAMWLPDLLLPAR